MTGRGASWQVPIEAVRCCATAQGAVTLARLECQFVRFRPHCEVELSDDGFVAHVSYETPPFAGGIATRSVPVLWVPQENALHSPRMEGVRT